MSSSEASTFPSRAISLAPVGNYLSCFGGKSQRSSGRLRFQTRARGTTPHSLTPEVQRPLIALTPEVQGPLIALTPKDQGLLTA